MRRPALLLLGLLVAPACSTWAEIHGPTVGVALEITEDLEVSPRLQIGYDYDTWTGMVAGYGGGGGLAVSLLESRVELYGELRGTGFPLPWIAVGGGVAYSAGRGWELALRAGASLWPIIFFQAPDYCSMGWYEQTRDEPCPPTAYAADDVVYPLWMPRIGYRMTAYWSLADWRVELVHDGVFDATIAWFRYGGTAPGPTVESAGE